jgi:hypothetical protein
MVSATKIKDLRKEEAFSEEREFDPPNVTLSPHGRVNFGDENRVRSSDPH